MSDTVIHVKQSGSDAAIRAKLIREGKIWYKQSGIIVAKEIEDLFDLRDFKNIGRCGVQGVLEAIKRILCKGNFADPVDLTKKHSREVGPAEVVAHALGIKALALKLISRLLAKEGRKLAAPVLKANGFYSCLKVDARNTP